MQDTRDLFQLSTEIEGAVKLHGRSGEIGGK